MRTKTKSSLLFFSRSLIWSALIYAALMLLLNWEDITSKPKSNNAIFTGNFDSTIIAKPTANTHI